jgi:hypothetical protein
MMLFERFISQEFQIIVNSKMRQLDFEPGAVEFGARQEPDMKQNSMLLSVTDKLPVAPPPPGEKVNNKIRVFPKDKWLQPSLAFPPYDEASSPKVTHRKRARRARSPAPELFQVPTGDGQVIIADSMPTHCRVYPAGFVVSPDTGVTLAAF